ncbi:hypothetical protein JB92DRAFT_3115117 [Gautieria morchelliformis]|nr:hypothetical protein JB92DRAFT_3115117 [Gautieria morchelliformis]
MTSNFEVNLKDRYKGAEINIGSIHHLCMISALMITLSMPIPILPSAFISLSSQQPPPTHTPDVSHVLVLHTQYYTLNVSVGLAKGSEFVFEGEGNEIPDWEAGDIIIHVLGGKKTGS